MLPFVKKLSNPVADLTGLPFQFNDDQRQGPNNDGGQYQLKFQPVIPITLDEEWNLISRTIVPFTFRQHDMFPGNSDQSGLGDVVQSYFFSPQAPTERGLIWGVGPALMVPTASDKLLGHDQYALGPTAVVLKQDGPWTYSLNSESTYDWTGEQWSASVNMLVSKMVRVGKLPVQVGAGLRRWADSPANGPKGYGVRLLFTQLFPK